MTWLLAGLGVGPESAGRVRRIAAADAGLTVLGAAVASGTVVAGFVAEVSPPRREPRLAGVADDPAAEPADSSADEGAEPLVVVADPVGPGADTDAASSSPGVATAIPAPGAAVNATPRANAAAPARAPALLTDMTTPVTANC